MIKINNLFDVNATSLLHSNDSLNEKQAFYLIRGAKLKISKKKH